MVRQFGERDMVVLEQARRQAEELTGDHFKLARFGPDRYAYEVASQEQLNPLERAEGALAKLVRYVRYRPGPGHQRTPANFFRICLQDPCIFKALDRSNGAFELEDILVYVLTHELVHLVRFEQFAHLFDASEKTRLAEEAVVYRTTHEILRKVPNARLEEILRIYESSAPFLLDAHPEK